MANPKKVLIVEDEDFYVKILKYNLENLGFETVVAMDGKEGLKKLKSEKPDLLLLDLLMPVKDGFYVLEQKEKDSKLKKIPVIVLTNLSQEKDIERCRKFGVKEYLIKSNLTLSKAMETISSHLKKVK